MIRVLVVEDSPTVRARLVEALTAAEGITVVGEAQDGSQAIEMCQSLRPDIVTLDMMLPVMSGLAATEYIMAHIPTPILIVSASINRGELFRTYDALAAGAVDVLDKPNGGEGGGIWEERFVSTVKLVSRIKVITHPRARLGAFGRSPTRALPVDVRPAARKECTGVALGASTGGPGAVVEILRSLPPQYPLPILLVVHIGEPFGKLFAEWLDAQTIRRVSYARDGDSLSSAEGRVVMAPPDRHLILENGKLRLTSDPERHSCRPSIDALFESVARELGARATGCLLTGMGRDGAEGLLEIRRKGGITLAQDESTSVVYGMPREAALIGAVEHVLPLGEIGPALAALAPVHPERKAP